MNILSIIQLVVQFAGPVKAAIDLAESNLDLVSKIKALSSPLASLLEGIGATLFPKAAPELHIVGGVLAAFDPNTTKWLQGSLNTILGKDTGYVPLVVDGSYGPKTKAAVEQFLAKLPNFTPNPAAGTTP